MQSGILAAIKIAVSLWHLGFWSVLLGIYFFFFFKFGPKVFQLSLSLPGDKKPAELAQQLY